MSTTIVFAAMAAYILVIALLGVIDWKITKVISMMSKDNFTANPMKNKTKRIEYR